MSASLGPSRTHDLHPQSQPHINHVQDLPLPDARPVDEHHPRAAHVDVDEGESEEEDIKERMNLPWWKRPSPWWLLCGIPFTAIAMSATIAPRIEVYTILACRVIRPDIYDDAGVPVLSSLAPTRSQLCAADPVVQAAVAKFAAAMTTTMGILSCLTTGWWSAFSDRYGRNYVMGISALGLLLTDFIFIFVFWCPDAPPGGYWFLLLGPLVEGSLGGFTSAVAAIHAYQADTTNDGNRSRIFSLGLGLLFTGMAIGPTLGALLIRSTGQLLSVFYAATGVHIVYIFLIWFVLPQSLSMAYRRRARAKYAQELQASAAGREEKFVILFKRLFGFLSPLAVFAPKIQEVNNPLKRRKDWSLVFLGLAYGITVSIMGSYTYKFQYAASTFGWTSEDLGYWLSLVGAARAFFLTAILPLAIKLLKPKPVIIEIPEGSSETSPLLSSSNEPSNIVGDAPKKTKEIHSPAFELGLARASLLIDVISYTFMGLATSALSFTIFGMLGSMGAAYSPATQAVALALYTRRGGTESGRLFGALSVLQALGSQILGPPLYGYIYMKTVATYPRTIFFISVGTVAAAFLLLACIRLPKQGYPSHLKVVGQDEDTESISDLNEESVQSSETTPVGAEGRA